MGEPDIAATFYVSLGRIVRLLRQDNRGSVVGPGALSVLVTLDAHGPQRVGTLADTEGVTAPSMTRIVNALEGEGLVQRAADPDDGRAQVITLTPAGAALLSSGQEAKLAALRRRLAALSPADRAALKAALPALEQLGGVSTVV